LIKRYEAALKNRLIHPIQEFLQTEATGGILLLIATAFALFLANSPWGEAYHHFLEIPIRAGIGDFIIDKSLHHWVNEGLMVIFFFLVGLEIKREVLAGELASPRKAALPFAAAIGGMLVPALCFAALNMDGPGLRGWGIPMATDIAFALGILALLGSRVPIGIPVFLTALAIIDDLGGVLVIALFYGGSIETTPLMAGFAILALSYAANKAGIRNALVYAVFGIVIWLAFLNSGIHATIAGVLLAMTIPERAIIPGMQFAALIDNLIGKFKKQEQVDNPLIRAEEEQAIIQEIETACKDVEAPLQAIEHKLHPWVAYLIMPLFAFSNAGVEIHLDGIGRELVDPITLGIILGLVVGKQGGIMLFSWLAVRMGWADLPSRTSWFQLYAVSWLAGIGFTMSLFIGSLAFADPVAVQKMKIGILLASAIAGLGGYLLIRLQKNGDGSQPG
ncbi:MAG TPA: Na+/H+ antiporter NhaA, partial [Nitrospiria bacterium]